MAAPRAVIRGWSARSTACRRRTASPSTLEGGPPGGSVLAGGAPDPPGPVIGGSSAGTLGPVFGGGSLEAPDIPRLLLLEPDTLGFRRALCRNDRAGAIDPDAVALIRGLIPLDPRSAAHRDPHAAKVDYRLLAARGYAVEPNRDEGSTDRVLVRDFVLPVRIGAYAHEREKPQKVRFNVDVKVLRPGHAVEDMRDVFSYDLITDGIRVLVAREHFPFVESLAA